mmetsp:Transcript_14638/g.16449  ORF Transcript_14638/g.16449 Transcript_14638/m.16449 type:complete len:227 (-) Transcript_14638:979-1659(-)
MSNTKFLDSIECVPYRTEYYESTIVYNSYGKITTMSCENPESGFDIPILVHKNNNSEYSYYESFECCKTGTPSPPYIQDYSFQVTVYPQIMLSTIAVLSTFLFIVALLIPLWLHPKNKVAQRLSTHLSNARLSTTSTINRLSTHTRSSGIHMNSIPESTTTSTGTTPTAVQKRVTLTTPTAGRGGRRRIKEPIYSSYNLYLAYLLYLIFFKLVRPDPPCHYGNHTS